MTNKITVVCDNCTAALGLMGEHGFSALIDWNGISYLFDTGGPFLTLKNNLKALGRTPDDISKILLSHGHYDHTGGLEWMLKEKGGADVIAHADLFCGHGAAVGGSGETAYVGPPKSMTEYENMGARFEFTNKTLQVADDMWFVCNVERDPAFFVKEDRFVLTKGEGNEADLITDDASILIKSSKGVFLILGCAHSGVVNILNQVKNELGFNKIHTVIGGTHFINHSPEQIKASIEVMKTFGIENIKVSHCTGLAAAPILASGLGDKYEAAAAGVEIGI